MASYLEMVLGDLKLIGCGLSSVFALPHIISVT